MMTYHCVLLEITLHPSSLFSNIYIYVRRLCQSEPTHHLATNIYSSHFGLNRHSTTYARYRYIFCSQPGPCQRIVLLICYLTYSQVSLATFTLRQSFQFLQTNLHLLSIYRTVVTKTMETWWQWITVCHFIQPYFLFTGPNSLSDGMGQYRYHTI